MTGTTHAVAGAALGALAAQAFDAALTGAAVGAVAALLPDIDHPGSYAGRLVRPISVAIEERYGHRYSPMHTVWFAVLAGMVAGLFMAVALEGYYPALALAGALGGLSHILLDALTPSGVRPFRLPRERGWDRKFSWKIRTGESPEEKALALLFLVCVMLILTKGVVF